MFLTTNAIFSVKNRFLTAAHSITPTPPQSKRQPVKDVHVVVVWYLLRNSSSRKVQCGTRNASTVLNATDHWTPCWLVMVQTRKFTAVPATASCSDLKDLDLATLRLLFQRTAITAPHSTYQIGFFFSYTLIRTE